MSANANALVESLSIAFHPGTLRSVIKAIAPFASTDEFRPIITGVHVFRGADGRLTVESTNSYILGRATLVDGIDGPFDAIIPAAWLARWARLRRPAMAKPRGTYVDGKWVVPPVPNPVVELRVSGRDVQLIDVQLGESFTCRVIEGDYPNADEFITAEGWGETEVPTALNPRYFRTCLEAAWAWGDKGARPLRMETLPGLLKPVQFWVDGSLGRLDLVQMPVRVP
jgi:hypothetical protein